VQRLFAIAWLTWKAALRFRLFVVVAVLLLAAVVGLPILIKDDHTARGFTQILLTYTLSTITALLGLSTLWLACGTLARDIEDCTLQTVAVKPIARWQIWLGKWLGIMSLNAALLALSGASVYGLLLWRATKLPPAEQAILREEVLVARGSAKPAGVEKIIETETERLVKEKLKQTTVAGIDLPLLQKQTREQVKAEFQNVGSGEYKVWQVNLGLAKNFLRDQPLHLRIKFNAAEKSPTGAFVGLWQLGVPDTAQVWRREDRSLAPETFHEYELAPNLFDDNGTITIVFLNANETTLIFPLEDGIEVLYREGGFGLNFARGLGVIFCWMALLATLGLAAASFLSFPVAAFSALAALLLAFSTGTLSTVAEEGTILGWDSEKNEYHRTPADAVIVPVFKAVLQVINLAKSFSPIDSLSTGRSVSWGELGLAVVQVVLLLGGVLAVLGIWTFHRRELATAQGNQ
jgi:hypothetical protein